MTEKKAIVKHVEGMTFVSLTNSNHWIVTDVSREFGGTDAGIRPKELLLVALGGCTGGDVATILRKKRVPIDRFELHVTALESEEHPKIFTSIHIEYLFYGSGIRSSDVERAIDLSQTQYCGVSAMLGKTAAITHSFRIDSGGKE